MRDWLVNILVILGVVLVALGIALVYMPAGIVALGVFLLGAAYLLSAGAVRR